MVSGRTTVLLTKKGIKELDFVDPEALRIRYQLSPEQVIDLKGLMGDSSDNIPGVPGVGEKTALKLLQKYGSIDGIYENLEQEQGKLKERLATHKELAYLSRELATIDCQIPITVDFASKPSADVQKLISLFRELEFKSLIERLEKEHGIEEEVADAAYAGQSLDTSEYVYFRPDQLPQLASSLASARQCGVYYDGEHMAIACGGEPWYIDRQDWGSAVLLLKENSAHLTLYSSDSKSLAKLCARHGGSIEDFHIAGDLALAAYVLIRQRKGIFRFSRCVMETCRLFLRLAPNPLKLRRKHCGSWHWVRFWKRRLTLLACCTSIMMWNYH